MSALVQLRLPSIVSEPVAPPVLPDLGSWDWIVVSTSGGKDSVASLSYVVELAELAGVRDRVVAVHSDLGRVEWKGTAELARAQAEALGIEFILVSRIGITAKESGVVYQAGEQFGDILDYARRRGAWPSPQQRWCTSEFKRGPIGRAFTMLANRWRSSTSESRPCRILDVQGLRAEESPKRRKMAQLFVRSTPKERKDGKPHGAGSAPHIATWLPLHRWTEAQVWERIRARALLSHPAYALGMPRLSCVFCIFAPKAALVLAGRHNRELLEAYVEVERETGHRFKVDLALADIAALLDSEPAGQPPLEMDGAWNM